MSRRIQRVCLLVVMLGALAGCGSTVDLAKVTFSRTTVPAATGSTGTPGDAAFTAEKLRRIDPCALLDRDTLASVGTPAENQASDFSQCANYMKDSDGRELNITLTVGEGLVESPSKAQGSVGGLPAMEQELDDRTACFQTAVTETSPHRGIRIQAGGAAPDKCEAARTLLQAVVERIRADPPTYDPTPGTLRELDPCAAVGEADITPALGAGARSTPTNLHWCTWSAGGADVWIWLRSGVDPAVAELGKTQQVDVGVPAIQESDTTSGAKCDVSWAHLPLRDDFAEVVSVTFVRYDAQPGEDPCAKAAAVARALVPKLTTK